MHAAVQHVDTLPGQLLTSLKEMVRIPTVNPPGSHYDVFVRRDS